MSVSPPQPVPRRLLWQLLVFGTVGPLLFDLVYTIDGASRSGYDPSRQAISTLMEGQSGWIQQANFVYLGLITLAAALVWRKVLKGGVCAIWYPISRVLEGLSLIMIGFALTDPLHTILLFVIIGSMMSGLVIISRRFWGDPIWRGWTLYSVASAILINVFIALFGIVQHTTLGGYAGILERVATNIEAVWGLLFVLRLWAGTPFYAAHDYVRGPGRGN